MIMEEYAPASSGATSALGFIAGLLFLIAAIPVGYIMLKGPLAAQWAQTQAEKREREQREQEDRRYRVLQNDVEAILRETEEDFRSLQRVSDAFARQVEEVVGVPFETAHLETSRPLDHAILRSEEFATTWCQLLNARLTSEMIEQKEYVVAEVNYRWGRGSLTDRDRTALLDLQQWIKHQHDRLLSQRPKLVFIANVLHPNQPDNVLEPQQEGDPTDVYIAVIQP